ncbi:MAG: methylated-DNA--[protein]-cysteine S-methyltransferase, partial [Rhodothermales bacterium]|nr:methylated-DNA--[protein]-cysteine S-methyltransferase [Rhodothermales bacterium]
LTLRRRMNCHLVPGSNAVLVRLTEQLGEYFAGERTSFAVPIDAPGTAFQESVWNELRLIPSGTTISYAALAAKIGRSKAVRAVARANGDNRLAILIPCHRVVGSDGKLTGYAGGLWRKQRLLDLESVRPVRGE